MTQPTVERIATFAVAARPVHLTSVIRQLFKRNILDSLGCAIAALPGPPFPALREQFGEYRAPGRCTLIGGGKTSADQAALFNSALVRYIDLLDSYMAPGGLCHPSDNFGTVLAAAEQAGASGEEFMLALAVAYEIQCRFSAAIPVMAKGSTTPPNWRSPPPRARAWRISDLMDMLAQVRPAAVFPATHPGIQ